MEQENFNKLTQLVDTFGVQNNSLKELKKVCDEQSKAIKEIMAEECLHYFCADEYTASYVVKESTKVNEEKLLALLSAVDGSKFREIGIIQTKEYIDADNLENAIYNGYIDSDLLSRIKECYTATKVPTLIVKQKGKK